MTGFLVARPINASQMYCRMQGTFFKLPFVIKIFVMPFYEGPFLHRFYYCRFGNFRENFVFANSFKRHISDVKDSRLRQDLPISINDRVILPFRVGFIFPKLRICEVSLSRNFAYAKFRENKVLAKITEFTV